MTHRIITATNGCVLLVIEPNGQVERVDEFATRAGATFAKDELERGAAHVEPHRTVGCRVQPGGPS